MVLNRAAKASIAAVAVAAVAVIALLIYNQRVENKRIEAAKALAFHQETVREGNRKLERIYKGLFLDSRLASATSRITLAVPVSKMRDKEDRLIELNMPECLGKKKAILVEFTRSLIDTYSYFMADNAEGARDQWRKTTILGLAYEKLKPNCTKLPLADSKKS